MLNVPPVCLYEKIPVPVALGLNCQAFTVPPSCQKEPPPSDPKPLEKPPFNVPAVTFNNPLSNIRPSFPSFVSSFTVPGPVSISDMFTVTLVPFSHNAPETGMGKKPLPPLL